MTDLVDRLRERAKVAREEITGTALGDALHFEEAANEIDRLSTPTQQLPMLADIAQIIYEGWQSGDTPTEIAAEILREFTDSGAT